MLPLTGSLGRRTLLVIGSLGYVASLGLRARAFATEHFVFDPVCLFGFIAAHAVGQGAVICVFFARMMVLKLLCVLAFAPRARGISRGDLAHRLCE